MSGRKRTRVKSALTGVKSTLVDLTLDDDCRRKEPRPRAAPPEAKEKKETADSGTPDNWIDRFAPVTLDDLAVHSRKVEALKEFLVHYDKERKKCPASVALLTGPTGAGKTALVRVVAQSEGYQIQEWINPLDTAVVTRLGDQDAPHIGSQIDAFKGFLFRASRYKSLLSGGGGKRLLLVEDFPNALITDVSTFEAILREYFDYGRSPLVFVVADSKSRTLNIAFNLFTEQIKTTFRIGHIPLNPIAATLMQKAMLRFCGIMRQHPKYEDLYKIPPQTVLDSIAVTAQGDIRNALINLHFAALKGAPGLVTQPVPHQANKTRRKPQNALKSLGRDESITLLHAMGRVFNPKYTPEDRLLHSPEEIADNFSSEPKKFLDFVFANYLPHFKDIEDVISVADDISTSDLILSEYREEAMARLGLTLAARSCMLHNKHPVGGWAPVHGPKRLSSEDQRRSFEQAVTEFGLSRSISSNVYATDVAAFARIIKKQRPTKVFEKRT